MSKEVLLSRNLNKVTYRVICNLTRWSPLTSLVSLFCYYYALSLKSVNSGLPGTKNLLLILAIKELENEGLGCLHLKSLCNHAFIPSLHNAYFSSEPTFWGAGKKHYFTDVFTFGAKILGAIRQCLSNRLNTLVMRD